MLAKLWKPLEHGASLRLLSTVGLPVNDTRFKPNPERMRRGLPEKTPISGVDKVLVVSSGKGGVGKSTTAVNLALSLSQSKLRVGLLDVDLYGPSIPRLMNLNGLAPELDQASRLRPLTNYGVQCMSMGFLTNEEDPLVWRGMMIMKALQQLLRQVAWDNVHVLVVDMPPGTGDIQLSLAQQVLIDGAIIVSTPQDIALVDVIKGANMFKKVNVPILGIVENMSSFICPSCKHESHIFGRHSTLLQKAQALQVDVLGRIPLTETICQLSDAGTPVVVADESAPESLAYRLLSDSVRQRLKLQ